MNISALFKYVACVLLGSVFIFSAYTKLDPIEPFEYTFVDLGLVGWQFAPFLARLFIGLEVLIGVLLILNINLQTYAYKLAKAILLLFSIYLILVIVFLGNKGNCGCFGTYLYMTPAQALVKNVGMLILFMLLGRHHSGWKVNSKYYNIIFSVIALAVLALPFILDPIKLNYSKAYLNKSEDHFKLELDLLYKQADIHVPPPSLSKGKHVIAFMSAGCPHCRIAAKKMRIIHERKPDIPFYIVLNGNEKNIASFFEETKADNIPYCRLKGKTFVYLAGTSVPAIYLVNNSNVEGDLNYFNLNEEEIENWLRKK